MRRVVLDHLWRVAVVDLDDELGELTANRLVELLQELQTTALCARECVSREGGRVGEKGENMLE